MMIKLSQDLVFDFSVLFFLNGLNEFTGVKIKKYTSLHAANACNINPSYTLSQPTYLTFSTISLSCLWKNKSHVQSLFFVSSKFKLPTGWLSWLSTGLPCGKSWVRSPAGPTLRVFK